MLLETSIECGMKPYEWIDKNGQSILLMYIASRDSAELQEKVRVIKTEIARQPKGSVLAISDVAGGRFSTEITNILKNFAEHNRPYIRKSVVIGMSLFQRVVYQTVTRMTGRDIEVKGDLTEAIQYLTAEA